jgi:hypothetical protein
MFRLFLAAFLVLACGSPAPSRTPAPTSAPTGCHGTDGATPGCTPSAPAQALPSPGSELAAGRYTSDMAGPSISFYVADGWTTVQQLPGFFDIQDDPGSLDVVAVQFTIASGFETAEDAAADIEARANLTVSDRQPVVTADLQGIELVVETTDPADAQPVIFRPVLDTPSGPISIGSGRRLQINLFAVGGQVVAVMVGGSVAQWDRAVRLSQPVLRTVYISH